MATPPIRQGSPRNPKSSKRERRIMSDANREAYLRQAEQAVRVSFLGGISKFKKRLSNRKLTEMFNTRDYDGLRDVVPWEDLPNDMAPAAKKLGEVMAKMHGRIEAIGRDEVKADYLKDSSNPRAAAITQDRIGKYLQDMTDDGNAHVHDVVESLFKDGHTQKAVAQTIKAGIGLNDRQRVALANAENRDIESGKYSAAQVQARKEVYAAKLLDQRATMIAVTETRVVANSTESLAWQAQAEDGILDPQSRRVWVTEPDCCDVCVQLSGVSVGLYESWNLSDGQSFPYPPAHPRCRCSVYLLAPGET